MNRSDLVFQIKNKKSFLCIGLDTDINKIPKCLLKYKNPVLEFNKQIIESTKDLCISYKLNTAFYESAGVQGWQNLVDTLKLIPEEIFTIADAKRGDIGNTSGMYAKCFFDKTSSDMEFDAVTVAPYMGADSVKPFLSYQNKWVILLALTSNAGSEDFQFIKSNEGYLYEQVLKKANEWATSNEIMFVVGATKADNFAEIRRITPHHFYLVPGVGEQGGSLETVCKFGLNADCGLIINSSRAIIYASSEDNFAEAARSEALKLQKLMEHELLKANIIY